MLQGFFSICNPDFDQVTFEVEDYDGKNSGDKDVQQCRRDDRGIIRVVDHMLGILMPS